MSGGGTSGGRHGGMAALGDLVCDMNPYTQRTDPSNGYKSGLMDVLIGPGGTLELEVDAQYAADWTFKGAPQKINTAVRIKYRYPVTDKDGTFLYYIEDYLLLGYEGAGGP